MPTEEVKPTEEVQVKPAEEDTDKSAGDVAAKPAEVDAAKPAEVDAAKPAEVDAAPKMKFVLVAKDDEMVIVPEDVAFQSNLLKKMVSDLGITSSDDKRLEDPLPVSNVNGWTLKKILEWCEVHKGEVYKPKEEYEDPRITLTPEDKEYLNVTPEELCDMLMGANYLDIPGLIDIITQSIADMAKDKTVNEIRLIYGLENDFTPEEDSEMKKRFEWVDA